MATIIKLGHTRGKRSFGVRFFMFNVIQYLKSEIIVRWNYISENQFVYTKDEYRLLCELTQSAFVQQVIH